MLDYALHVALAHHLRKQTFRFSCTEETQLCRNSKHAYKKPKHILTANISDLSCYIYL